LSRNEHGSQRLLHLSEVISLATRHPGFSGSSFACHCQHGSHSAWSSTALCCAKRRVVIDGYTDSVINIICFENTIFCVVVSSFAIAAIFIDVWSVQTSQADHASCG
jgi:hypothetical protein